MDNREAFLGLKEVYKGKLNCNEEVTNLIKEKSTKLLVFSLKAYPSEKKKNPSLVHSKVRVFIIKH